MLPSTWGTGKAAKMFYTFLKLAGASDPDTTGSHEFGDLGPTLELGERKPVHLHLKAVIDADAVNAVRLRGLPSFG